LIRNLEQVNSHEFDPKKRDCEEDPLQQAEIKSVVRIAILPMSAPRVLEVTPSSLAGEIEPSQCTSRLARTYHLKESGENLGLIITTCPKGSRQKSRDSTFLSLASLGDGSWPSSILQQVPR
jgi:hypothetical protein